MSKPIATIRVPKDHPAMAGHKPGDLFQVGAMIPDKEGMEGAEADEEQGETPEGDKGHVTMHVTSVAKHVPPKAKGAKKSPMEYLKGRQK